MSFNLFPYQHNFILTLFPYTLSLDPMNSSKLPPAPPIGNLSICIAPLASFITVTTRPSILVVSIKFPYPPLTTIFPFIATILPVAVSIC